MPRPGLLEQLNGKLLQWAICKLNKDLVLLQNEEGGWAEEKSRAKNNTWAQESQFHTLALWGSCCDVLMRWRPLQIQMFEEGGNKHRGIFWVMRRLFLSVVVMNMSQVGAEDVCCCFTPLTSLRGGRTSSWTKRDRGPSCRVSTRQPPVSINARPHAWHNLLKQDCLYFLTQLLPQLRSPNQLYFTVGCVCLTFCCCAWWSAGPWLTSSAH